jgi:SSS family solute:Na+ symporter
VSFLVNLVVTIVVSLMTDPKPYEELRGLVWSLTDKPKVEGLAWYRKASTLGLVLIILPLALNFLFF